MRRRFGEGNAVAAALDGHEAWARKTELPYSEPKLCGKFGERMKRIEVF